MQKNVMPIGAFLKLCLVISALLFLSWAGWRYFSTKAISEPTGGYDSTSAPMPKIPPPPTPSAALDGPPDVQAIHFADLLEKPESKLSGWLGIYDALGIPVIDANGHAVGTTGDDPIGPRFWQLWYMGAEPTGRGIPLRDATRLLGAGQITLDPDIGQTLLQDLQYLMTSEDSRSQLLGRFLRERILRSRSHVDLLTATSPDNIVIDLSTFQLMSWVIIRHVVLDIARTSHEHRDTSRTFQFINSAYAQALTQPTTPCSSWLFNKELTYWTDWAVRKIAAKGLPLPVTWVGNDRSKMTPFQRKITNSIIKQLEESLAPWMKIPDTGSALQKDLGLQDWSGVASWMSALMSAITLAVRVESLTLDAVQNPDPLVRPHSTQYYHQDLGNPGTVTFALSNDHLADPNDQPLSECISKFAMSVFGTQWKSPAPGRVAGAELLFDAGSNIPAIVIFDPHYSGNKKETNEHGEATIDVIAKYQKRELPNSAKPVDKEFSVIVHGQPEAVTGKNIVNIAFGGLTFGVSPGFAGGGGSLIEILKTVHFDLGEHVFRVTDWAAVQKITFSGISFDRKFPGSNAILTTVVSGELCGDPMEPGIQWTFKFHELFKVDLPPPFGKVVRERGEHTSQENCAPPDAPLTGTYYCKISLSNASQPVSTENPPKITVWGKEADVFVSECDDDDARP
jgi:hypothetical protein